MSMINSPVGDFMLFNRISNVFKAKVESLFPYKEFTSKILISNHSNFIKSWTIYLLDAPKEFQSQINIREKSYTEWNAIYEFSSMSQLLLTPSKTLGTGSLLLLTFISNDVINRENETQPVFVVPNMTEKEYRLYKTYCAEDPISMGPTKRTKRIKELCTELCYKYPTLTFEQTYRLLCLLHIDAPSLLDEFFPPDTIIEDDTPMTGKEQQESDDLENRFYEEY